MKKIILMLAIFNYGSTFSQSKKEQIEALDFRIDSLHYILTTSKISFSDSLFTERFNSKKQRLIIEQQKTEMELQILQAKNLNAQLDSLTNEVSALKNKLEELKNNQEVFFNTQIQYFTLFKDCSFNYDSEFYTSMIKNCKKRFLKYPEINSDLNFNVPSHSELTEFNIWWQGDIAYALIIVKDVRMVVYGEENETAPEISLNYYILKYNNNQFEKEYSWQKIVGVCIQDSENKNLNFQITDLNKDGKFETWCVNENYCVGGIHPSHLFVYMYENGKLYTMKSVTNIPDFDLTDIQINEWIKDDENSDLSINQFDSKFLSIPNQFRQYAIKIRNENILGGTVKKIEEND